MGEKNLNDICYEHIIDSFHYGIYLNFKLVIDKKTGNFNATKLCKSVNKRLFDWIILDKSKRLIEYLKQKLTLESPSQLLYKINLQNNNDTNKKITGTYVCKELLLAIASWLSDDFYFKCNKIIINYAITEFNKITDYEKKLDEINENLKNVILKNEEITAILEKKNDEINKLQKDLIKSENKICEAVKDRAPLPSRKSKQEQFILIKLNNDDDYGYYVIRGQKCYINHKVSKLKVNNEKLVLKLRISFNPNSRSLYNIIKEKLIKDGVIFFQNFIELGDSGVTENNLIKQIKDIYNSKYKI